MPKPSYVLLFCILCYSCNQNSLSSDSKPASDTSAVTSDNTSSGDTSLKAQNMTAPLKTVSLNQFIPENYSILDTSTGDLNKDTYPDMIMVLKKNGEDSTSDVIDHPEKRPLLILLGQPDNTYKQAARSDSVVLCVDCGGVMGDPFQDVVIKNGFFSVELYGGSSWRWTRTITFKYFPPDNNWYLHKDGGESYHSAEPDKAKTTVKTVKDFGKVAFTEFDVYKDF